MDLGRRGTVLCSENKGANQLRSYSKADLRLCFRICKKQVFLMKRVKWYIIMPVSSSAISPFYMLQSDVTCDNQRTNGPVNAHLISGPTISIQKKNFRQI